MTLIERNVEIETETETERGVTVFRVSESFHHFIRMEIDDRNGMVKPCFDCRLYFWEYRETRVNERMNE